jgi:outer membrane receptor protein involved in Fe transport
LLLMQPGGGLSMYVMPEFLMVYSSFHMNFYELNDTVFEKYQHLERYRLTSGVRSTPAKNLSISSWFDIVGPRKTEFPQNPGVQIPQTGNIFLLNAQAEYRINGLIGVYVKAYNLLNQNYRLWPYFEERPLQIYGGVTFKF